jgi:putative flavoprotein involved in K+ transport
MAFPAPARYLPLKDEVADYLEAYAKQFSLPVRLNTWVESVTHDGDHYTITTSGRSYQANFVVIATGAFHTPYVPAFHTGLDSNIQQLHSSEYRNPDQLQAGAVLVVGAGNSGVQIAIELAETRRVWLSGRSTGTIPRQLLGKDIFWWLTRTLFKITIDPRLEQVASKVRGGDAIYTDVAASLARSGAERVTRTEGVKGGKPMLEDGRVLEVANVVWSTGFRPDYRWISLPVFNKSGYPNHYRGVVKNAAGLYFVGLPGLSRLNSSLLGGVGGDAEYVAAHIAAHHKKAT